LRGWRWSKPGTIQTTCSASTRTSSRPSPDERRENGAGRRLRQSPERPLACDKVLAARLRCCGAWRGTSCPRSRSAGGQRSVLRQRQPPVTTNRSIGDQEMNIVLLPSCPPVRSCRGRWLSGIDPRPRDPGRSDSQRRGTARSGQRQRRRSSRRTGE
jgi:hypothetical protein